MNPAEPVADPELAACVQRVANFAEKNLTSKIAKVEFEVVGLNRSQVTDWLHAAAIDIGLLTSAQTVKRAAAQIDVVLHVLGILVLLPSILNEGELVEGLSLGAGSSKVSRFDLETSHRIAEFTFIEWTGNDNTRLQKIFKDFYRLVEFETTKAKELWLTDDTYVLKYLRSRTSVRSATHKYRDVWEAIQAKYPSIDRVSDYFRLHEKGVALRVYDRQRLVR
jgi:hypothetical protein